MKNLELDQNPRIPIINEIEKKIQSFGFKEFSPIQKKAIPVIIKKKDCLVIAPTGSGKTECSVLPVFYHIKKNKQVGKLKALYITPLRALNRDVFRRIINYGEKEGIKIEVRHGDTSQKMRKKILDSPPDVLITTPETLLILLTQKKFLDSISVLDWLIIDEVHELLENERGSQLTISMERLQISSNHEITRIGLSATVGNSIETSKFLVGSKRKCKVIKDYSLRKYDVGIKYVKGTISDVADNIITFVKESKISGPILLFTNTRGESEFLASLLKEKSSIPVELHHGSLSKQVREDTEESLRKSFSGIVVCTSSLELGIDIGTVELVIHYGSPRRVSKFMQRIGRSRHSKGASAKGLIITNNIDDELESRAILERISEGEIDSQEIHFNALDVLAHHLVGFTMQFGEISVEKAYSIIKNAFPFRKISMEQFLDVLNLLDSNYIIFLNKEKMTFKKKFNTFKYYFENLSTIPDILKFKVFDSVGKKIIGTLDQRFVGNFGEAGNIFVLKGSKWRILNVDEKSLKVNVEPIFSQSVNVPYWEGESIPVEFKTANKVGKFRTKIQSFKLPHLENLFSDFDPNLIPDTNNILIESVKTQGILVLHCCFGTKINYTLSVFLSSLLSSKLGFLVESRSDAYRIVLSSNARLTQLLIEEILHDSEQLDSILMASIKNTHNHNWKTWCVSKKFGIVTRGAVYDRKSAHFLSDRYYDSSVGKEATRELLHDKFDIQNTSKFLKKIQEKKIQIHWEEKDRFSQLAEPILDHSTKYYSSPASIDQGLLDVVKERLMRTNHRLICLRCGKYERTFKTNEIKTPLFCPYCRSRQIAATFYSDTDFSKIIRKKFLGKKISNDENHRYKRAWKVASLIENFGKTAIIVLSGYGIGADTAARILRNMVDETELFKQIYLAERQYVMTRGFWES